MSRKLRIGVVGCGSIAQIAHIPNLRRRPDLFELVGLADVSRNVARWSAERFHTQACESYEQLIEHEHAQALLVAIPHAVHADVLTDAVERGVHVLVEKPLCVASRDGEAIAALAERHGVVVQVGYMKRYDDAFAALCADLEADGDRLLGVYASTIEAAGLPRTFQPRGMPTADDISSAKRAEWTVAERCQMQHAIGSQDPKDMAVYRSLFLADLIHDLNLIHALLAIMGEQPAREHDARWWNAGRAGTMRFATVNGVHCAIDYIEVPGMVEYEEQVTVVTERAVHRLRFPAPYLDRAPTAYERRGQGEHGVTSKVFRSVRESFASELECFHASVLGGAVCRTPARESVVDMVALERSFVAGVRAREVGDTAISVGSARDI